MNKQETELTNFNYLKWIKMKIKIFVIILITFCSCTSTVRLNKDYQNEINNINKITVLPPRFEYFERGATMNETKPEFVSGINENIVNAINENLSRAGYNIVPSDLTEDVLIQNQEMALILTQSYDKFIKSLDEIDNSNKHELEISLIPEIGIFADYTDADYLIYVAGSGYNSSEGAKVKDVGLSCLTGILFGTASHSQWSGMQLYLAVVNANTSEIIWFNRNTASTSDFDPMNYGDIYNLCEMLLREGITGKL